MEDFLILFLPIQKATHSEAGLKSDTFRRRAEKRHIQTPGWKATHSEAGLKSDTFRSRAEKRHIQKPGWKATHSEAGLKSDTFRSRAEKRHIQEQGWCSALTQQWHVHAYVRLAFALVAATKRMPSFPSSHLIMKAYTHVHIHIQTSVTRVLDGCAKARPAEAINCIIGFLLTASPSFPDEVSADAVVSKWAIQR